MFRRSRVAIAVVTLVVGLAAPAAADQRPAALDPPTPARFVANLDLECFRTSEYTPPPLPAPIVLSHLNPVLADQPRWEIGRLGPRTQLCSPVAKNEVIPPKDVLEFVRYVDLSCYRIDGPRLQVPLVLSHLNPVLADLPRREVVMMAPETLCLPVLKNSAQPPAEVLELVRYLDLVCYSETPQVPMGRKLLLTQLNPELAVIPPTTVLVQENRQLCVPVRKNDQQIPERVLEIVRWVDLETYAIAAPDLRQIQLRLRHINPLLVELPPESATLLARETLAVPVAKNGKFPPG